MTASINALYELALQEKDYPAQVLLQWFITEQVEEEKNAAEIVQSLELIDARGTAVLMLDHQLGKHGKAVDIPILAVVMSTKKVRHRRSRLRRLSAAYTLWKQG